MEIIAKPVGQEKVQSEVFELFTTTKVKDIDGIEVTIPQSLGHYSLAQLENEKQHLQGLMDTVNEKIAAINLIIKGE